MRISFILQFVGRICKLIGLPVATSLIIASLSKGDFDGAYRGVAIFVAFSFTLGVANPLIKYIGLRGENPTYIKVIGDYFTKLVSTDIEYFNSNLSGYLTAATRQYADTTSQLIRDLRDRYMNTVLSIFFPLIIIAWLDPLLGFVALVLSVVLAVYMIGASRVVNKYRTRFREAYKKTSGRISDIISNILAVKSASQEKASVEKVEQDSIIENQTYWDRIIAQTKLIATREFIVVITFVTLFLLTVHRMSGGYIDITAAVLVVTYATTILTGIYSLSEDIDAHDDYIDKIIPAFDILNRENLVKDPVKPAKFDHVRGQIEFRNVSFSYDNDKEEGQESTPVFRDFSLTIPAGQKIGIVGLSGAGKSTLAKLLLRFSDVDAGQVLIDNTDIRDVRQTDLRRQISYVPQEPLLLHASIRDNVILSDPNANDKEIKRALQTSHAASFVNQLPDGENSIVGERGVKLSGGQKQRVAIARAVLQDAPIMVLDEATSALDSDSEQIIKNSFSEILRSKTAVVIAHRLSTLSDMDRIIVIEKGRLAEDGTHDELLKKNGVYARLWKRQLKNADELKLS